MNPLLDRLLEIARKHLLLDDDHPSFETRGRDSLDFIEVSVKAIGQALDEAYQTGRAHASRCPTCGSHRPHDNATTCATCCEELERVGQ